MAFDVLLTTFDFILTEFDSILLAFDSVRAEFNSTDVEICIFVRFTLSLIPLQGLLGRGHLGKTKRTMFCSHLIAFLSLPLIPLRGF